MSIIIAYTVNYRLKYTSFYLDSALKIYICYNKLLFSIYKEEDLQSIYIRNHAKLIIIGKNIVIHNVFVDCKLEFDNFCKVFFIFELKYNLFSVAIIEKINYGILTKKNKIIVFNNKNNITLEIIRITISYLINVFVSNKILAFLFFLLLKNFELE